ncbi:Phosphoribosyl 1,2-cyclic phosphate phosphodiesterase [Aquirufa nivalisilvae]|uniref:Phosphoribosyl 1,2-cyclic phosphate phosphodiesterase n=1 Tax=Aquirufa nivalisilvae TaxID=2516557 RepID=A0A2S2DSU8_9BACT|nr:Phosphoribosyl 1,2-cyclic phosphate phosphodiesterase [Aquirufa nivalisilvae]
MSPISVEFLGTGTSQGIPMIACSCEVCTSSDQHDQRLRVSMHIQTQGKSFIIDTGPDFRQQMLRASIKHVDAVIYTHEHKDHTAGMDDLRGFNYVQKSSIPLYAQVSVIEQLKREFAYAFGDNKYPGVPEIETFPITNQVFEIQGVKIQPILVRHYMLDVFGFRFGDFTYITDANYISEEELEKVKGSQVLVINALKKTSHISHFTLDEALEIIEKVKPERAYITHISHQMGLHAEVQKELPPHVYLAYDGLQLSLS